MKNFAETIYMQQSLAPEHGYATLEAMQHDVDECYSPDDRWNVTDDGEVFTIEFLREITDEYGDETGDGLYLREWWTGGSKNERRREYYCATPEGDDVYNVSYIDDVDPDIERVADLLADNIWINPSDHEILARYNRDDDDIEGVCHGYGIFNPDAEFVAAVRARMDDWFEYRPECFVRDASGNWQWREEEE